VDALNEDSRAWIEPALKYLTEQYTGVGLQVVKPLSVDEVNGLLGWEL